MIVADTSVWIRFLREPDSPVGREMTRLLRQDEVAMTGMVMAEVLQGGRNRDDVDKLADLLGALTFLEADRGAWALAGSLSSDLRRAGVTTPLSDLVIAAVAMAHECSVFAQDDHFERVQGLRLHRAPTSEAANS